MKIRWLGHSCFLLASSKQGLRILIDPYKPGAYDGAIGHKPITDEVDIVLVTHEHPDHAGVELLPGRPLIIRGQASARGMDFDTLEMAHDAHEGRLRGRVRAFVFQMDGLWIAHLGDLGHWPSREHFSVLKKVQVLFIPVGGLYTIDGKTAWRICQEIGPNLAIPMHFRSPKVAMDLEPVEVFLENQSRVRRVPQTTLEVDNKSLPQPITTIVLTASN